MKIQIKKYYLCAMFLMTCAFASAQSPVNTEEKELYLKIYYVYSVNDTNIAFISDAQGLGIKKGNLINSYQAYSNIKNAAGQNRKFTEAGTGKIVKADSIIAALVKLFSKEDSLAKGDLISIRLNIPKIDYRGIFSDLAFNQVYFSNLNNKNFFGLKNILYTDNKQTEDSLYSVFLKDLHDSYISMKDMEDMKDMVNKKITGGRFAGKTYLE